MKASQIAAAIRYLRAAFILVAFTATAIVISGSFLPESSAAADKVYYDHIVASFDRGFDREPISSMPATGSAIDEDVLYQQLNTIHWSADKQ